MVLSDSIYTRSFNVEYSTFDSSYYSILLTTNTFDYTEKMSAFSEAIKMQILIRFDGNFTLPYNNYICTKICQLFIKALKRLNNTIESDIRKMF